MGPSIPKRLERAISYLVSVSDGRLKLYGLSVRKFEKGKCKILELSIVSKPLAPKMSEKKVWSENEVIEYIGSLENEMLKERLLKLVEAVRRKGIADIGGATKEPRIYIRVKRDDKRP